MPEDTKRGDRRADLSQIQNWAYNANGRKPIVRTVNNHTPVVRPQSSERRIVFPRNADQYPALETTQPVGLSDQQIFFFIP